MTQTAVDWLLENVHIIPKFELYVQDIVDKAKQIEKEQISKAHYDGYYREDLYDTRQYYNDTYGK
jgi:uncharacterized protein (DUF433 family)